MNIPDHISESLETIFWVKILKVFDAYPDPGSMNIFDPGSGIREGKKLISGTRDKHSGSATLSGSPGHPALKNYKVRPEFRLKLGLD